MTPTRHEETGMVSIPDAEGAVFRFKHIWGCFAWGDSMSQNLDLMKHSFVVAGEAEDGVIVVLREHIGTNAEVEEAAVNLKDELWISRIYAPVEPEGLIAGLRQVDGLSRYKIIARNKRDQPIYYTITPTNRWPFYRSRKHIAPILEIPAEIELDTTSSQRRVSAACEKGRVEVSARCPTIERQSNMKLKEGWKFSTFRAYVWLVVLLLQRQDFVKASKIKPAKNEPAWHWRDPRKRW